MIAAAPHVARGAAELDSIKLAAKGIWPMSRRGDHDRHRIETRPQKLHL